MAELKPCPFCGGEPRIVSFKHTFSRFLVYQVMCFACHTKPKYFCRGRTEEEAIEAWNRRAGDES
jgi:Lar family restriction alleviation protein